MCIFVFRSSRLIHSAVPTLCQSENILTENVINNWELTENSLENLELVSLSFGIANCIEFTHDIISNNHSLWSLYNYSCVWFSLNPRHYWSCCNAVIIPQNFMSDYMKYFTNWSTQLNSMADLPYQGSIPCQGVDLPWLGIYGKFVCWCKEDTLPCGPASRLVRPPFFLKCLSFLF